MGERAGENAGISRTARFVYPDRGRSRYRPILQRVAIQYLLPVEQRHLLQFRREVIPRKAGIEQEVVYADGQIGNSFAYLRADKLLRRRVSAGYVDSPLDIPFPDIDAFAGERAEVGRNQPIEVAELGIDIVEGNVRRIDPAEETLVPVQAGEVDGALPLLVCVVPLPGKGHEAHRIGSAYLLEGERPGRSIDRKHLDKGGGESVRMMVHPAQDVARLDSNHLAIFQFGGNGISRHLVRLDACRHPKLIARYRYAVVAEFRRFQPFAEEKRTHLAIALLRNPPAGSGKAGGKCFGGYLLGKADVSRRQVVHVLAEITLVEDGTRPGEGVVNLHQRPRRREYVVIRREHLAVRGDDVNRGSGRNDRSASPAATARCRLLDALRQPLVARCGGEITCPICVLFLCHSFMFYSTYSIPS